MADKAIGDVKAGGREQGAEGKNRER